MHGTVAEERDRFSCLQLRTANEKRDLDFPKDRIRRFEGSSFTGRNEIGIVMKEVGTGRKR